MIEIEIFDTIELARQSKSRSSTRHQNGFRPLHTEFKNNKVEVTFVNGLDDPHNDPIQVQKRQDEELKKERDEELKQKAKDKTLSKDEQNELLERLSEIL